MEGGNSKLSEAAYSVKLLNGFALFFHSCSVVSVSNLLVKPISQTNNTFRVHSMVAALTHTHAHTDRVDCQLTISGAGQGPWPPVSEASLEIH